MTIRSSLALVTILLTAFSSHAEPTPLPPGVTRVPLVFSGGHETDRVDHGRPVALIAAALGVKTEVFRQAFSNVHPAGPGSGGPTGDEARANKAVLLKVLAPYGITNDRLDAVSNYYRYPPGRVGLWKHQPATGNALIKDGVPIRYELSSGGAGYTTPPVVSVLGLTNIVAKVELSFGTNMVSNGAVSAITIPEKKP